MTLQSLAEARQQIIYLGPQGTFSEEATLTYLNKFGNQQLSLGKDYSSIPEVISAVAANQNYLAIVPLENSSEGPITVTLDLLAAADHQLYICGEVILPIHHHLLGLPGTSFDEVEEVLSHPQALAQSQMYLQQKLMQAATIATTSTAEAARQVAVTGKRNKAAIGPRQAASHYGLEILVPDIQDRDGNCTRFILLGHSIAVPTGHDKTSLVFSTPNEPGALYKNLGILAEYGVNMTKIESRPTGKRLGEYLFFVDIDGHCQEQSVSEALRDMEATTHGLRVLGSYPKAEIS